MAFPSLPTYVRNDPFGPTSHNNLLQRTDYLAQQLAAEHDPITGEHNTPHVARTLGHIDWNGATYAKSGFNSYASTLSNPAVGTVQLRLTSGSNSDATNSIIEVQPADDTGGGDGNPWIASARWANDRDVQVFLKKNTAVLGSQQTFAATDGSFFLAVRAKPFAATAIGNGSNRRVRGDGLKVTSTDWNPAVQRLGDNRLALLTPHTSAGLHNVREVAKAWGYAHYDSSTGLYRWVGHQGLGAGVVKQSTGVVRIYLANAVPAISSPVQAFARAISSTTGTDHTGIRLAHVPESTCGTSTVDVYLYQSLVSAGPIYTWERADFSFFIRVHGA